jgi:hypothetical protein
MDEITIGGAAFWRLLTEMGGPSSDVPAKRIVDDDGEPLLMTEFADPDEDDCPHDSAYGVDRAPAGDDKVWRCCECGLLFRMVSVGDLPNAVRLVEVEDDGSYDDDENPSFFDVPLHVTRPIRSVETGDKL